MPASFIIVRGSSRLQRIRMGLSVALLLSNTDYSSLKFQCPTVTESVTFFRTKYIGIHILMLIYMKPTKHIEAAKAESDSKFRVTTRLQHCWHLAQSRLQYLHT